MSYNNFFQLDNVIPFNSLKMNRTIHSLSQLSGKPLEILNRMYKIPKSSYFKKPTEMYNSTGHDCAVASTNAMLNYEWLPVNCSRIIENALIVCEKKKDDIPENSHSVNISSLIEQCRPYESLVEALCMHLSDRFIFAPHARLYV